MHCSVPESVPPEPVQNSLWSESGFHSFPMPYWLLTGKNPESYRLHPVRLRYYHLIPLTHPLIPLHHLPAPEYRHGVHPLCPVSGPSIPENMHPVHRPLKIPTPLIRLLTRHLSSCHLRDMHNNILQISRSFLPYALPDRYLLSQMQVQNSGCHTRYLPVFLRYNHNPAPYRFRLPEKHVHRSRSYHRPESHLSLHSAAPVPPHPLLLPGCLLSE